MHNKGYVDGTMRASSRRPGAGEPVSPRGNDSREEDWAEAVAAEVYPGTPHHPLLGAHTYKPDGTQMRSKYVREQFAKR
jgi:hypothetical protein